MSKISEVSKAPNYYLDHHGDERVLETDTTDTDTDSPRRKKSDETIREYYNTFRSGLDQRISAAKFEAELERPAI
jgi:hypothetical protein